MRTGRRLSRPLRAGATSFAACAASSVAISAAFSGPRCAATQTRPFPCLAVEFAAVLVAVPLVFVLTVWGLRGRGRLHALLGALVSLGAGVLVGNRFFTTIAGNAPDLAGYLVIALMTGLLAALWAAAAPGRRVATADPPPTPDPRVAQQARPEPHQKEDR